MVKSVIVELELADTDINFALQANFLLRVSQQWKGSGVKDNCLKFFNTQI